MYFSFVFFLYIFFIIPRATSRIPTCYELLANHRIMIARRSTKDKINKGESYLTTTWLLSQLLGPHLDPNSDWSTFNAIKTLTPLLHIWMLIVTAVEVLGLETFLHHTQLSLNFTEMILYVNIFLIILNWICVCLSRNSQERGWERNRYASLWCIYAVPVPW